MKQHRAISVVIAMLCVVAGVSCLLHGAQTTSNRSSALPQQLNEQMWGGLDRGIMATPLQRNAAIVPILAELKALRKGDDAGAEQFELSTVGAPFASPDRFHTMLRRHFPEIVQNRGVNFLNARTRGGNPAVVEVDGIVLGKNGGQVLVGWITKLSGAKYRIAYFSQISRLRDPNELKNHGFFHKMPSAPFAASF